MRQILVLAPLAWLFTASPVAAQERGQSAPVIIDVHIHAFPADAQGPPPVKACPGATNLIAPPASGEFGFSELMECERPLVSPTSSEALMRRSLEIMERFNVIGVASGPAVWVRRWLAASPQRILAGTSTAPPDSILAWASAGQVQVIGELGLQYQGIAPDDSIAQQYFALGEQLDLPVALHMGPGPPGAPYVGMPRYRMRLSDPLLLEETLLRRPKLRLYVMHAGWPMLDRMIALLWAHPQVYVDLGVISWAIPRTEFHGYLRRLVEAGFGKRIMFASDQMVWPEAIQVAIENVEAADFLSAEQKRDIFCRNAARFLRLDPNPC